MIHDYQLDWRATADRPVEVCVVPGHGLHTRDDELNAIRYPHLFSLDILTVAITVRPQGQLSLALEGIA